MFKRLAKAGVLVQILVILLLGLVYFITPQANMTQVADPGQTAPLGAWLYGLILSYPDLARPLVVFLIIALSLTMNAILIRHDVSPRQSVFPAIIALILMLFTPDAYHLIVTLACLILLLFSLHNVMNLYGEQRPFNMVMNATVAISVASMISPPVIVFIFFVWFGFFTFRTNSWREWAISLMGLILPYFYLILMYLWNDNLGYALRIYQDLIRNFSFTIQQPSPLEFISLGIFAFWTIISAMRFLADANERVISIRKKMWVISHFTFAGIGSVLLSGSAFLSMLPFVFMPVSAMIAHAVSNGRRAWIHDIILVLSIAMAIFNRLNV